MPDTAETRAPVRAPRARAVRPLLAAVLLSSTVLWGCGLGDDALQGTEQTDPGPSAVAGQSFGTAVSKPVAEPATAEQRAAPPALRPALPAGPPEVPSVSGKVRYGIPWTAAIGVSASLDGGVPFPIDDSWNREVSRRATDPASDAVIASIGVDRPLQLQLADPQAPKYAVVDRMQPGVAVRLKGTDAARIWPIPEALGTVDAAVQRLAVIDRDAGLLYELHGAVRRADGSWDAAAGASWRLDLADAPPVDGSPPPAGGGMPMLPGLLRHDEVDAGVIRHALRLTVPALRDAWLAPARASAGGADDAALPPVGLRLRLRPTISLPPNAGAQARAIVRALQTYGAIVVGTGPGLTIEGAASAGWDVAALSEALGTLRAADFEALAADGIVAGSR